jgi:hypothetical protein
MRKVLLAFYIYPRDELYTYAPEGFYEKFYDEIQKILNYMPSFCEISKKITWSEYVEKYKTYVKNEIKKFEERYPEYQEVLKKAREKGRTSSVIFLEGEVPDDFLDSLPEKRERIAESYLKHLIKIGGGLGFEYSFIPAFNTMEDPPSEVITSSTSNSLGKLFLLTLLLLGAYAVFKD